jgi:protein-disulfide isomerase
MRHIAIVMLGLLACADEEKLAALEKKVTELEEDLKSARKDYEARIDDQAERNDLEQKLEELQRKLDKIDSASRIGAYAPPAPRPVRPQPDAAIVYSMAVDGYPSIGPDDAKVTIVKAYDHACPFCERTRATMKELREKYRGDVRIVYKPLVVHPSNAMAGALATCASHQQGKFEQMDAAIWDKGFNAGRKLDASDTPQRTKCWDEPAGCTNVVEYAKDLGLNLTRFKQDMRGCMQSVTRSMADFNALSVAATPGFFINGRFLSGAQPLDAFVRLVDEELRKANERIARGTKQSRYYDEVVVQGGQKTL